MRPAKEALKLIRHYKKLALDNKNQELNEYDHGLVNGLEIALSLLEDRPVFYLQKDKTNYKYDMEKYPDYFI